MILGISGAGTRFSSARNTDEEEDVASEHEDQTNRVGYHHRLDPHHSVVCLSWFQLWKVGWFALIGVGFGRRDRAVGPF